MARDTQLNTAIKISCDWNGDFVLKEPNGKEWFYLRKEWEDCLKHMQSLIRPPSGDPK